MPCPLCDDNCGGAALSGLLVDDLEWLWLQLAAAADRRGDPRLTTGRTQVVAPQSVVARTAAAGLLRNRPLGAGQRITVDLADLAEHTAPLAPGAVAAHAAGRRLAQRSAANAERLESEAALRRRVEAAIPQLDDDMWAALRRGGWVSRVLQGGGTLVNQLANVLDALPGPDAPAVDRRVLAHRATEDPHGLDASRPVSGATLSLLAAIGRIPAGLPARDAWAAAGVAYDDITGGLTVVGIAPDGWTIPAGAPVTLPPHVLARITWPSGSAATVFVTENPSVLAAALDIPLARVVCTSGTPSRTELEALGRLSTAGWRLRVRADFDDAGINHMNAMLRAAPTAQPWRMGAADYDRACTDSAAVAVSLRRERLGPTPWDPALRKAMDARGVAAFEEALLEELRTDIRAAN